MLYMNIFEYMNQTQRSHLASDLDFKYWKYRSNSVRYVPIPAKGETFVKVSSSYVGTMAF